jgi:peptide/nickel transport system permease protein
MRISLPKDIRLPLALVGGIFLITLLVPFLPLENPVQMLMGSRLAPPSLENPLGRDEYGRDVLSRILWGARTSLSVAFTAALVAGIAGTFLGLIGGYFRGVAELLTVRASEVILCLPPLLLALLVVTLLGPGAGTLIISLGILYTPGYARVVYAETLSVRALDYVAAQETLGTHPARIMLRTVLPNVMSPLIVQFSLTVASAMVLESGLSFLGLGVVPPEPSWGLMIRSARSTMEQAPLLLVWPCLALSGAVIMLNILCDKLRDVLDPRSKSSPSGASTRRRVAARLLPGLVGDDEASVIQIKGLTLQIAGLTEQPVVRDVSFSVRPGETVALVGESGSGKTLTGLALLGLLPPAVKVTSGSVEFTRRDGTKVDLLSLPDTERRKLRGDEISMIFQDPSGSLNPVHRVGDQVAEAMLVHRDMSSVAAGERAVELLAKVGLPDPERRARSYPHELSGGQKQRAMIASAISNKPKLLIADEPTTALDVTIQAQILELLDGLRRESSQMGMIFVTHNLAVVAEIADRVCIMYAGEIVEEGPVGEVFAAPKHPYTRALLASVPEGGAKRLSAIPGSVPTPDKFPAGCRFASRCERASPECKIGILSLQAVGDQRVSRCLKWKDVA